MKKFIALLCGMLAAGCVLTGCVPKNNGTIVNVNPDFNKSEHVRLDMVQLHNDSIEAMANIEGGAPYVFITNVDINGTNDLNGNVEAKEILVKISTVEGATEEDCQNFVSALLCQINDAACVQDLSLEMSTPDSFGTLYDSYRIRLQATEDGTDKTVYYLEVPAGEEIPLDPDFQKYVDEWVREYEVYKENVVYNANGEVVDK